MRPDQAVAETDSPSRDAQLRPELRPGFETCVVGDMTIVTVDGRLHLALDEHDAALLSSLDGSHSTDDLEADLGPSVVSLVADLHESGFLVGSERPAEPTVVVSRAGLEFDGFDRVVARVDAAVGHIVCRPASMGLGAIVGLTGLVAALRSDPTTGDLSATTALALLVAWTIVSAVPHELAHALVVHRGGRRVGRAGFGLHWGTVAFFVDATDAFFMPRRTRVLQTLAGPFTDVVIAGALGLAAAWAGSGAVGGVLGQLAVLTWLSVLMNLSPLLELDGQHALEDLLDEPDLHDESFSALRRIRRDRSPRTRLLAGYAAAALVVGLGAVALSALAWWTYYVPVMADAWSEGLAGRLLATLFAGPTLAAVMAWALQPRRRP